MSVRAKVVAVVALVAVAGAGLVAYRYVSASSNDQCSERVSGRLCVEVSD
ncbi:hypothetical protein SAMN05421678_117132 [Actinopolymorpha cephalotaxi]|uniref:Uncharacterized protein n=1 Tax=Actinopolymorpha cephalotaxi TaxID=504797 RepID=A0A1I2ZXV5_9ACTN|nr:hypothetical protein [Actinopolymorpha cephalotaxi]NYH84232.1 hypothetical protein [Actinopolymorpha cephalotaxi]SFH42677.1 hypothetical protein SAMN05421678_117132 [Actinopolymorpha cephalotaxi]